MPRKIIDLVVEEISLVDKAANRKKFAILKRRNSMLKEFKELLKSFYGEDELEEDLLKKAEGLDEKTIKAQNEALEMIIKYSDALPPELLKSIQVFTKAANFPEATKENEFTNENFIAELIDVDKAGSRLSKATLAQLKKAIEILQGLATSVQKGATGDHKDLPDEVVEKLALLDRLQKAEAEKEKQAQLEKEKKLNETIEELTKKVDKLTKEKGKSQGLPEEEIEKEDEDEKNKIRKKDEKPASGIKELRKRMEDGEDVFPSIPVPILTKTSQGE